MHDRRFPLKMNLQSTLLDEIVQIFDARREHCVPKKSNTTTTRHWQLNNSLHFLVQYLKHLSLLCLRALKNSVHKITTFNEAEVLAGCDALWRTASFSDAAILQAHTGCLGIGI